MGNNSSNSSLVFRHELKFLINNGDKELLKQRLNVLMSKDENASSAGNYKIRSLYFDDYWGSSYEEKMMGVQKRNKYRIRIYDDRDSVIHLERKIKDGSFVSKQSASLTRTEAEALIRGEYGFLLKNPQQLCREFYYECTTKLMRPRVIVDYEREPYTYYTGDVRITFDEDVRAGLLGFDLFDPQLPTLNVLDPGRLIMEVKYTQLLPSLIKKALPPRSSELTAVSKYVLSCDRTMFLSAREG